MALCKGEIRSTKLTASNDFITKLKALFNLTEDQIPNPAYIFKDKS